MGGGKGEKAENPAHWRWLCRWEEKMSALGALLLHLLLQWPTQPLPSAYCALSEQFVFAEGATNGPLTCVWTNRSLQVLARLLLGCSNRSWMNESSIPSQRHQRPGSALFAPFLCLPFVCLFLRGDGDGIMNEALRAELNVLLNEHYEILNCARRKAW